MSTISYCQDKDTIFTKLAKYPVTIESFDNDFIYFSMKNKNGNIMKSSHDLNDIIYINIYNINESRSNFIIKEFSKDSILFTSGTKLGIHIFKNQDFNNNFINFYYDNLNSSNIEFKYILYSLEKYRKQNNTGKWLRFSAVGMAILGGLALSPPLAITSGIVSIVGFIIDWNSLKYLKNKDIPQKINNKYILKAQK